METKTRQYKRLVASRVRIAISGCLVGAKVRYNGEHCLKRPLASLSSEHIDLIPLCPEVEAGLSVPREPIRLVRIDNGQTRVVGSNSKHDYTQQLEQYSELKVNSLCQMDLDGAIMKSKSPSCGMERVKVYLENGHTDIPARGVFTSKLMKENPFLAVEEEGRLNDPTLREEFFTRAFAVRRLKDVFASKWTRHDVIELHRQEKFLLLAHDQVTYRKLGSLVGHISDFTREEFESQYMSLFQQALTHTPTVSNHYNVLQHLYGFLKSSLTPKAKLLFREMLTEFKDLFLPLSVIMSTLKVLSKQASCGYVDSQTYLSPFPLVARFKP
tara:strand:+ start:854 stop:1834 length:981 start_codon:yes stop_codon:yes gene_type:complete